MTSNYQIEINVKEYRRSNQNTQSRETGNIGYTRLRKTNVINPHEMMIFLISEPGVVCLWQAGSELLLQVQTIVEIINYWYHYNIFIL
jgi:hypothetical protein